MVIAGKHGVELDALTGLVPVNRLTGCRFQKPLTIKHNRLRAFAQSALMAVLGQKGVDHVEPGI